MGSQKRALGFLDKTEVYINYPPHTTKLLIHCGQQSVSLSYMQPLSEIGDSGFIATTNGDDIGEGHLDMNGDCGGSSECSDIGSAEDEVQESDSSCANRDDMVFSGGAWRKSTLRDFEEGSR